MTTPKDFHDVITLRVNFAGFVTSDLLKIVKFAKYFSHADISTVTIFTISVFTQLSIHGNFSDLTIIAIIATSQ